ncbi:MAG: HRDC domain-containing protein [Gammaproteobacteria bacterium]|nr:HRDC domain-containing protein [Gammaproteobacteria bacterium]
MARAGLCLTADTKPRHARRSGLYAPQGCEVARYAWPTRSAALVEWREERARTRDRPRRWILGDEQLVGIARARPNSVAALAAEDVPKKLAENAGREILAALERSEAADYLQRIEQLSSSEKPDKAKLRDLQARAKARAVELGISPEILATKQDLVDLLLGRETARISETWRAGELARISHQ